MNLYNIFYKNKELIESNIKSELIWKDLPNATPQEFKLFMNVILKIVSMNEYFEWCTNEIQKFADEFSKYIK